MTWYDRIGSRKINTDNLLEPSSEGGSFFARDGLVLVAQASDRLRADEGHHGHRVRPTKASRTLHRTDRATATPRAAANKTMKNTRGEGGGGQAAPRRNSP